MRQLLTILATLCILAAPAAAQTIKSLGYNTTNGQIVAATNVVWTNAFNFSSNTVAAVVRTNLGLGVTNSPEFASITLGTGALTISGGPEDDVSIENASSQLQINLQGSPAVSFGSIAYYSTPIEFNNTTNAATTRTNLFGHGGISTNIAVLVSGGATNTLVFTNGLLKEVQ